MTDLALKSDRRKLKVSKEPHWQRLAEGSYLGFRRGPDTWVVRCRGRDKKQKYKALGEAMEFDEAKKRAEEWCAQVLNTAVRTVRRGTVRAALEAYVIELRKHGRHDAAAEAEGRFKRLVWNDPLAGIRLEDANKDDFKEWRDRVKAGRGRRKLSRSARTVNRTVRAVVAGLNYACIELDHIGNPIAWTLKPLRDDVEEGGKTAVFLPAETRRTLIAAASSKAALFFRGLELTGARPRELAATKVEDFSGDKIRLAHRKGRGAKLRERFFELSAEGCAFFKEQVKGKLPSAPIFTEDGKKPWRRHMWAREMRAAVKAYNEKAKPKDQLPEGVGAYAFRHARISELLQLENRQSVEVGYMTGTSVAMIERAYFKFIPSAQRKMMSAMKESA